MKVDSLIKLRKNMLFNKIIHYILLNKKGVDIPSGVVIGKNVKFPHNSVGTVIHPRTIIKDNVKIYQNVTIGRANIYENYNENIGHIIIEEGAIICAGAKILYKDKDLVVAKNSIIGANAVLLNSTGENEIWGGIPAKKIGERK